MRPLPILPRLLVLGALLCAPAVSSVYAQRIEATVDSTASRISYTGSAPLHDWTGTSRRVTGAFVLDSTRPDSSRAVIRAPVASFDSGNDRRDRKMREVTDADAHPFVRFRATEVRPLRSATSSASLPDRWAASGTLTFHGQTHPIDTTVDIRVEADSVYARTQFPVSLTRFDVDRPRLMWIPIGDTIRIDAQVVGRIDTAAAQHTLRRHSRSGDGTP